MRRVFLARLRCSPPLLLTHFCINRRFQTSDAGDNDDSAAAAAEQSKPRRRIIRRRSALDEDDAVGGADPDGELQDEPSSSPSPLAAANDETERLFTIPPAPPRPPRTDNDDEGGAAATSPATEHSAADETTKKATAAADVTTPRDLEEHIASLCLYLRATENVHLVNAEHEVLLFPPLLDRLDECSIDHLLEIVECPSWARSTLLRYGAELKDKVRDRIARDAEQLTPEQVYRCIVVMGMSAGRRKRDLEFFQLLGCLFVHHINAYKDPRHLVKVLTAFARAKVVPPNAFLSLMGRRFPVLNKKYPLGALPAYRALVNLYRMGHDQMTPFRFLADRVFEAVGENLKQERTLELLRERSEKAKKTTKAEPEAKAEAVKEEVEDSGTDWVPTLATRQRFLRITELKPSMFTKLLLILARFGAPHQQYLRPMIKPVILPALPYFPPPTFTRLLKTMKMFATTDKDLIVPVIQQLCRLGPSRAAVGDVLIVLRLLSLPDTPVASNMKEFVALCCGVFSDETKLRPTDMCTIATDLHLMARNKQDEVDPDVVEPLMTLLESFAARMAFLIDLGVLSLTHAEILEDICRQMQHPDKGGAIATLKALRRKINTEEGDDEYYMKVDIDVRETLHKMMIVNSWNTYGAFRPLPGVLQQDFRQALTKITAENVLESAALFERVFPSAMTKPLQMLLSRAVLAKLGNDGEEVINEESNEVEMQAPKEMLFTEASLLRFVELVRTTPLKRVKASPVTWEYVERKAKRIQSQLMEDAATRVLRELKAASASAAQEAVAA